MSGEEGERWGFFNGLSAAPLEDAQGGRDTHRCKVPTFANGITKTPTAPTVEHVCRPGD